jgi:hypothetical protein
LEDQKIYSEFSDVLLWIRDKHRQELSEFPKSLRTLAEYYLKTRLAILNDDPITIDPRFGRPFPYLVFWFANSFGFKKPEVINELALSLSYISLTVSLRDDLHDEKVSDLHNHVCLANLYFEKYYNIFKNFINGKSKFWYVYSSCLNEWAKYEIWNILFNYENYINPLSETFLKESSRYLVAITLPSLAALAVLTRNEGKIGYILDYLRHYWMGWKIVDDLRDWEIDLHKAKLNHSCVLYYALKKAKRRYELEKEYVISILLSTDSIDAIYNAIQGFYIAAKHDISVFNSGSLDKFMDTQISFYDDEKRNVLQSRSNSYNRLFRLLLASDTERKKKM